MPGTDVVGHHPDGTVVWSGTSFAAPNFAGCLAVGLCQVP
jgi:subtilase family serine protease